MKYRFFRISVQEPEPQAEILNRFLGRYRILSVDRQLVVDGQQSFWALSVSYAETESAPESPGGSGRVRKPKVDYRDVLSQEDFTKYAALRSLRKELADREGVPAYALFTNEQLATMVRNRVRTPAALGEIEGIGKARVEKYATAFLEVLSRQPETGDGQDAPDTD